MFKSIISKMKRDEDFPLRTYMLEIYKRILKGTFYDHLQFAFNEEQNNDEYVPLVDRRPSVRARLAKVVVDDSVSLLFDNEHFPQIESDNDELRKTLQDILTHCKINLLMIQAATKGSIGSVALFIKVLDNKLCFDSMWTQYLTPIYNKKDPDKLLKVVEKYKVKGKDLLAAGYGADIIEDEAAAYWIMREWDEVNETRYLPFPVNTDDEKKKKPVIDKNLSSKHDLGFIPIVWIKNLPFDCDFEDDNDIDGECTFRAAIETSIEIDYQLSQLGRGLRYTSDPTLLIKEPAAGQNQGAIVKGPTNAIAVDKDGDAKYLEITGAASDAVIQYVEHLRKIALENIHGNRSDADKIAAAQSGYAMELMHLSLVWLAGKLRITYGNGLLDLMRMIIEITQKYKLIVNNKQLSKLNKNASLTLCWPVWFSPSEQDKQATATTLKTLRDSNIISQESAVKAISGDYGIEDVQAEIKQIDADLDKFVEKMKPTVTETVQS